MTWSATAFQNIEKKPYHRDITNNNCVKCSTKAYNHVTFRLIFSTSLVIKQSNVIL